MSASVTLFTDRSSFETAWKPVLESLGLGVSTARPEQLPERLERDSAIVVDAAAGVYDEDELLAHLGLARAVGAMPAVMLPPNDAMSSVDDLVDDLCVGLVARSADDVPRVSAVLARRAGARRSRRFEYLTVSPRGGELLAILADGSAMLVPRPAHPSDDRSDVASITLTDDAHRAALELVSGAQFELAADDIVVRVTGAATNGAHATGSSNGAVVAVAVNGGGLGEIDGQRLGARIRALRLAAGLTQAELARRTGIHRPNIARVEAGRHTPSLETLARLAAAIGVPTTRVLTGD
ncbi:helix-turn-helix domain-containing protein [Sandaracinus amylolyticus]|uniref:helix-turn-helix domain-containing protein n=1 Tax=Sandaracinus amylolyticus TaxID=927083 RepID=UPI001F27CC71|nr:helix-turn-helix transcriptional regulator [Sandaracinus amylolyticus]UJR79252.1 HTH cro/C1-type domain-containing protein [Sandaracinus amylolyticus]